MAEPEDAQLYWHMEATYKRLFEMVERIFRGLNRVGVLESGLIAVPGE